MTTMGSQDQLRIIPANEATWEDLQTVLAGEGNGCQCQFFKLDDAEWHGGIAVSERADRLRQQTGCDNPRARSTSGLIAYSDSEPAGWCAVEPRTAYRRLLNMRVPWTGRDEDKADAGIWAVTCFVVRKEFRRHGIASALALAAVEFARERGARAVEGYPKIAPDGHQPGDASLYVGSPALFTHAGYREVSRPSPRRVVMRVDL